MDYSELVKNYNQVCAFFKKLISELDEEKKVFPDLLKLFTKGIHGADHLTRVAIYSLFILDKLQKNSKFNSQFSKHGALNTMLYASFFHDCARTTDGLELGHGKAAVKIWLHFSKRKNLESEVINLVTQAILFHEDHPAVDESANIITVCLCNSDRLDRVRLIDKPNPKLMYDDGGVWQKLEPLSLKLFKEFTLHKVLLDLNVKIC